MDGILNINKPAGATSFRVVSDVRHLCGERHTGHAGTLDPLATGVLPVLLGRATRVAEYLMEQPKTYLAEIEFGSISDSGDADGVLTISGEVGNLDAGIVAAALERFRGTIQQIPPMFSALKYHGSPLYKLARAGVTVERPPRTVEVYSIKLLSWASPVAVIEVTCSRGTYIRTIARDLGTALGSGAYLKRLCRTRYGPFDIKDAITMPELTEMTRTGDCGPALQPLDMALQHLPALRLAPELALRFQHGRSLTALDLADPGEGATAADTKLRYRACTLDGRFLGVLRFNAEKDEWQPEKVFS
jgi:tRNA pseudouridine55 synthase